MGLDRLIATVSLTLWNKLTQKTGGHFSSSLTRSKTLSTVDHLSLCVTEFYLALVARIREAAGGWISRAFRKLTLAFA